MNSHPFKDNSLVCGCPSCKEIETLTRVCDVDGCWNDVYDFYEGAENKRCIGACAAHAKNIKELKEAVII